MKRILLSIIFLSFVLASYGQFTCSPNQNFKDSTAGVYPVPYDSILAKKGGISTCAIIGQSYQFVFTVVIGDSLTFSGLKFPLDSVVISKVIGLPAGLTYGCNPGNCVFKRKTMGCAAIYGTPTSAVTPGKYSLKIQGTAYLGGSPLGFPIEFPGPIAPGTYDLYVLANAQSVCVVSSNEERKLEEEMSFRVFPNPSSTKVNVDIQSSVDGKFKLKVRDLLGREHYSTDMRIIQGYNRAEVNTTNLSNGLYIISFENGTGQLHSRVVVQH
jgi:hypothetical protein